ncbi:mannosyltransferase family protein [Streptomyces yaanensis]|uniref:Mannosyltransferase family protein n=1 Tax=Streptomyces yaanensis TaxID=1142239 RepID=A0ABV7SA69_9ACTN|nr:mannosyltransferase family protein [Streptomyces sp. CGMCC 4.7035]WNB96771.1 mannosyltransferase family protein [Streptomyces sp. CGMCC 4.7035]
MTHASTVPAPAVEGPGDRDRVRPAGDGRRLPTTAVAALGLFVAARVCGGLVLAAVARSSGRDPVLLLGGSWDSAWYLGIAAHGYGRTQHTPAGIHSDLAFFPLYPGLIRVLTEFTPLGGLAAGLLLSWTAAVVAAYGIRLIGVRLHGRAVATVLVLLWGLLPHSVVLSMAYTEPVLTAFAAWSLYAALTRRWVWAGALAALAGLSRPNGIAVAAAVLAAAAHEVWRVRGRGVSHRLWTGAALAPLGWGGYVLWVGRRRGDPLGGYFTVQRLWGSRFDFGRGSLRFVDHMLLHGTRLLFPMALMIVLVSTVLFALLIVDRAPLPLVVYSGVLLLVTLGGSGFFESKPRFLLPAFPLLIVVARALVRTARARPWHAAVVACALAGLSLVYGAYLVVLARSPL